MLVLRIGMKLALSAREDDVLLRKNGLVLERVAGQGEAADLLHLYDYDAVLMDEHLHDGPCHDVVRNLRAGGCTVPIVVLGDATSRTKALALDLGADDFITLPCVAEEILARLRAVVRRSRGHAHSVLQAGLAEFSLDRRQLRVAGKVLSLTRREALVLEFLFLRQGAIATKEALFNHLYCGQDEREMKALDVVVCRLRKKLADAGMPPLVGTVWGLGYTLRAADHSGIMSGVPEVAGQAKSRVALSVGSGACSPESAAA